MKTSFPRTLIQIHYHNRPGGVTRVMESYARAFQGLSRSKTSRALLICCVDLRVSRSPDLEFKPVAACEYQQFTSRKAFEACRGELIDALERVIGDPRLPRPVCVMGHNLTLGKNCALSSAFAEVARRYATDGDFRFISVIHDLAEEGRTDLMRRIFLLEKRGIALWRDLYPVDAVRFIAVNRGIAGLLSTAGCPAAWLPDPVEALPGPLPGARRRQISNALREHARKIGTIFDAARPTLFYPARVISRKNVPEAIMLACLFLDANLVVGAPGISPADRKLYRKLLDACKNRKLPVVFDAGAIRPVIKCRGPIFDELIRFSAACLSTSVAEGFGYALYEPWLLGTPVIGRLPAGFDDIKGFNRSHFYRTMPVPVRQVGLQRIKEHYFRAGKTCYGSDFPYRSRAEFEHDFARRIVDKEHRIDFAALDVHEQMRILDRLARSSPRVRRTRDSAAASILRLQKIMQRTHDSASLVRRNARAVAAAFSCRTFRRKFAKVLQAGPASGVNRRFDHRAVIRHFANLDRYKLLLSPE
jgi:hypothetical protein